ncbi:MAG: gluconate 2-dehydrogenase subunit 3 family protein [Candidatus Acidiferrum sp.]
MTAIGPARRQFLQAIGGVAGTVWLNAQWPLIAAAAQHAHDAVKSSHPLHFDVLTPAEAVEVTAIAARIIPTDADPGATEAGVVYFIDRALKTFASEAVPIYKAGLLEINATTNDFFPGVKLFSAASTEQQDRVLAEISSEQKPQDGSRRAGPRKSLVFFPLIWGHTMMGFLADPEAGGNFDYAGWKVIGRDPAHTFSPPFGYYDNNYPGWKPTAALITEKK